MDLIKQAAEQREQIETFQREVYELHFALSQFGPDLDKISNEDLADLGFLFKKTDGLLDELRKEFKVRHENIGRIVCGRLMAAIQADTSKEYRAVGQYGSATPKITETPVIPGRGTDDYIALLGALGVPEEHARTSRVMIHWTKFSAWLTEQSNQGINHNFVTKPGLTCTYRKAPQKRKS